VTEELQEINLEAKERELMRINEELDQKRAIIVKRAEKLLEKQQSYLQNCVAENVKKFQESCDTEIDDVMSVTSTNETTANNEDVSQEILNNQYTNFDDEEPRSKIPFKSTIENHIMSKNQVSKKTNMDTPRSNQESQEMKENDIADLEMEEQLVGSSKMSAESALRLQKARYKALQANYDELIEVVRDKDKQLNTQVGKIKELEKEIKRIQKKTHAFENKASQNNCKQEELEKKM